MATAEVNRSGEERRTDVGPSSSCRQYVVPALVRYGTLADHANGLLDESTRSFERRHRSGDDVREVGGPHARIAGKDVHCRRRDLKQIPQIMNDAGGHFRGKGGRSVPFRAVPGTGHRLCV